MDQRGGVDGFTLMVPVTMNYIHSVQIIFR